MPAPVMIHPLLYPILTLIAGIIILIFPTILNYIIAIYLIIVGILGIFGNSMNIG